MKFLRWFGLGIALFVLVGCSSSAPTAPVPKVAQEITPMVSVTGKLVPARWAVVSAQVGGVVREVAVEEGETVAEGDLLIRLDDGDARLAVQQAEAAVAAAEAQLAQVKAPPRPEDVAVVAAQVEAARWAISQTVAQREQIAAVGVEAELAAAEAEIAAAKYEQLVARQQHDETMKCYDVPGSSSKVCPGLGTAEEQARYALDAANKRLEAVEAQQRIIEPRYQAQLHAAEVAVSAATAQYTVAQAQLAQVQAPVRPEDVAVAEAAVEQAKVAVEQARLALTRTEVRAPLAGTVGRVDVRPGEVVAPGQPLITLGDLTTLRVETTDLDEVDVAKITLGQQAAVTFDALPDRVFNGTIVHIAPMADLSGGGVTYRVIIELPELDPALRWGMTAFVDIKVEE